MPNPPLQLDSQSLVISQVRHLIRETADKEQELTTRISKARTDADKVRDHALAECEQNNATRRDEALQLKEKTLAKIERRKQEEPDILKEKHEQRVIEINTQAEEIAEQSEAKLNEAIWLAESVYEGAIPVPRKQAQEDQKELDEANDRLDALKKEAPRTLSRLRQDVSIPSTEDDTEHKQSMLEYVNRAEQALETIRSDPKAKWFSGYKPHFVVLFTLVASVAGGGTYTEWALTPPFFAIPICASGFVLFAFLATYASGKNSVRSKYREFASCVSHASSLYESSMAQIDKIRRMKEKGITTNRDVEIKKAEARYKPRLEEIDRLLKKDIEKEKTRFETVAQKLESKIENDTKEAHAKFDDTIISLDSEYTTTIERIKQTYSDTIASLNQDESNTLATLKDSWNSGMSSFNDVTETWNAVVSTNHPSWSIDWSGWSPPNEASLNIPIGRASIDLTTIGGDCPTEQHFPLPTESTVTIPICSCLPDAASFLIATDGSKRDEAIAALQVAMMRSLTSIPPGKAKFTLIDPVGLGQSFAGVLHLADFEDAQLLDRAWTEPKHIDTQLARLTEHMETVIQKYLRNEFKTIDEYNKQAGEIAEPYRFLVIADLPNNFSENAAKRLASIITSGARCGVYVLIHRDNSLQLPNGIDDATLNRIETRFSLVDDAFIIEDEELSTLPLTIDTPPSESSTTTIVKKVGERAEDTHRVEVPFGVIAPSDDELWSRSTTNKVAIPLGRAGASKLQNLTLGRGTAQHALIAGKTGSGKSTLLHVLITNLSLWYSPEEVEFYLVDFKKGVEFKTYATHQLPHARVVAVESDREFGISVLKRIDEELKRRGELFRELGAQDIAGFRDKSDESMPRILLIIDEFQEFFVDDDQVAQEANLLLDRLVRQGRAFGIHAIMGSQTLDGAYTLSRSTMGQMAVRVALQCSEQDSYIILNEDNAAARLLSRPGEAIYNDAAGKVEGNSPFQIVWLDESLRESYLSKLAEKDGNSANRDMVVYEGNKPTFLADNTAYATAKPKEKPLAVKAWLGGAMAIKEDTAAVLRPTSASNLLLLGQQEETITTMVSSVMQSIDAQYPPEDGAFILLDSTPADSTQASVLSKTAELLSCHVNIVNMREVELAMRELYADLQDRLANGATDKPTKFLVINGLHRYRDLRRDEDDFGFSMGGEEKKKSPAQILVEVLKEGPTLGIHVIAATDTLTNLNRTFDRQALREFDLRVLLQMGTNDSTNLIDSPAASKLGMHRALLYSEETGTIEPFRPYSPGM